MPKVRQCIKTPLADAPLQQERIAVVQTVVCDYWRLSWAQVCGPHRHLDLVEARQVCMYLLYHTVHLRYSQIGAVLGRDHTTVIHGVQQIERAILRGGPTAQAVADCQSLYAAAALSDPPAPLPAPLPAPDVSPPAVAVQAVPPPPRPAPTLPKPAAWTLPAPPPVDDSPLGRYWRKRALERREVSYAAR